MQHDSEEIQKLKNGERLGIAALIFCGAVCVYFIICFAVAQTLDDYALRLSTLICAPVLLAAGVAVAAFCNLKFGRATDNIIEETVREALIENAALLHPERESLTYYISDDGCKFSVKANNFKEVVDMDFSAFGKLSLSRRAAITSAIADRLSLTFLRLLSRGNRYRSVAYCVRKNGKNGKTISIIEDGTPDKRAYKKFMQERRKN